MTTITFFRFDNFPSRFWALRMMQEAHRPLKGVHGQLFYKLLGSGSGTGFNLYPDWSVYSLLQVWDSEASAKAFLNDSQILQDYRAKAAEVWTLFMQTVRSKGTWGGVNPFNHSSAVLSEGPVASITRATVNPWKLHQFWRQVPSSRVPLEVNNGLLFKKGISDIPLLQMATFSVWKNEAALNEYVYKSQGHRTALVKAQRLHWFSEELFARFIPYDSTGTWFGKNLLSTDKF